MLRQQYSALYRTSLISLRSVRTKSTASNVTASSSSPKASPADKQPQAKLDTSAALQVETTQKVTKPADPSADYARLLEERFGGSEAAALGQLVDGKPQGMAKHVQRNMFRLI
ncbi:uncharacterized protein JCM15063_004593 [Sporobolomyces koalae]|uniref:uncharacterized protein n=1 Tax=Sporobolomyces koalae TaxID=500713 RepID=UPI00318150CD